MREWTPEQRKAFAEKMAAKRAVAKAAKEIKEKQPKAEAPTTPVITEDQLKALMDRLAELEKTKAAQAPYQAPYQAPTAQITPTGQIVGITEKFPVNKALYAHVNPIERLLKEPKLSRFAVAENYTFKFDIQTSRYQTKMGTWLSEPRFELEVRKKVLDDDGNKVGEYSIQKFVQHEDYDAAVDIAMALGIDVDPAMGKEFIDEMRYQGFRMFVEELFFPARPSQKNSAKSERVINGTVVTFYEDPKDLIKG